MIAARELGKELKEQTDMGDDYNNGSVSSHSALFNSRMAPLDVHELGIIV